MQPDQATPPAQPTPPGQPDDSAPEQVPEGQKPDQPESGPPKRAVVMQTRSRKRWIIPLIVLVLIIAGIAAAVALRHKGSGKTPTVSASTTSNSSTTPAKSPSTSSGNHWKGTVNPAAIPLGDGKVSTTPKSGYVDSCTTNFKGGGAQHSGSWINSGNDTWDSNTKVAVEGSVHWPAADYSVKTSGSDRVITTNDLPETYPTGIFPIARTDPAFQYDRNPNHIGTQNLSYTLPLNPTAAATPNCTSLGAIGVLSDGVALFNGLDASGRDAVAHETQDKCNGHPDGQEMYHYHDVPSCIRNAATGSSTLVGYALDGYGIYVERDSKGNLPTNADLDACHGRTSPVEWNGKLTTIYHYDATLEYPYTIGCFHGTPVATPGHARPN